MAFNFEINPVAINNISKTLENLKDSLKLQDKTVEIDSNGQEIITADSEYDGLGKVTINTDVPTKPEEVLTETITENGLKTFNPTAGSVYSSASITVNVPEKKIEAEKTVSITENKETIITPTPDNAGMARVVVTTNIPQPTLEENKTQTISSNSVVEVTPSAGNDGMKKATITVSVPEKKIEANKTQSIVTNGETVITPTEGNDGMAKVTVNVNVPAGGSGFDFTQIGYTSEENTEVNDELKAQVAYSKSLYDEWDPVTTDATSLYRDDETLVYAPHIDTSNVTNMSYMFQGDGNLKYVPSLNTSNVTNMRNMFTKCVNLEEIPDFDYSKVTNVLGMFTYTKIRALHINLPLVTNASRMFQNCENLQDIRITFGNDVVDLSYFLQDAHIDNLSFINTNGIPVSNLSDFMVNSTGNDLDLSSIKFLVNSCSSVTNAFMNSNLTVAPVFEGSFSQSSVDNMFYYSRSLTSVGDISFDGNTLQYIFGQCSSLQTIGTLNVPNVDSITYCFESCTALTTIGGLVGLKTDVDFKDCPNLSNASIQNLIDNAADVNSIGTRTMTFNATPFATITEEQRAAATAKGWTLASA